VRSLVRGAPRYTPGLRPLFQAVMQRPKALYYSVVVFLLACGSLFLAARHMSQSVWFDESQTNLIAHQDTIAGVAKLARTVRPYPPLFFLAVHESLRLRDDETGLRMPAALFGALAIFAVFLLGREVADEFTGAIAAFLFVLTPGAFRYFVDGNPYTLLVLASALSMLYLFRASRSNSFRDWLLYALFALLGLSTHILFIFHFGAHMPAGLYLRSCARATPTTRYKRLMVVMSVLFAVALSWSFLCIYGGDARPIVLSRLAHVDLPVTLAGMYLGPLALGGPIPLVLWCPLQLLGAVALFKSHRDRVWALAILIGLPLLAITLFIRSTAEYVAYKYVLGVFPLACIVAAVSWKAVPLRPVLAKTCFGVAALAYCLTGAVFIARAGPDAFGFQDWRSASQYLNRQAGAGAPVLVRPRSGLLPLTYYYKSPGVSACAPTELGDRVAAHFPVAGQPGRGVWVVLRTFANDNPLVARYTEFPASDFGKEVNETVAAIEQRGLSVCQMAHFHRVTVFAVRSQPCPPASPAEAASD
jgi:4-amino-4-deoxy-L-arabinose transferase-like glycosyltransferase